MSRAMTSEGFTFDPGADVWQLGSPGGPVRFDLADLPGASAGLRALAKEAFRAAICSRPAKSVYGHLTRVRMMLRSVVADDPAAVIDMLTLAHVQTYQRTLPPWAGYLVLHLRDALTCWISTGVGGISADLVGGIHTIHAEPHAAGRAVRTCSPTEGALAQADVDRLLAALHDGHSAGVVALDDYCLCLLVIIFAPRPLQLASLHVRDLVPASRPDTFGADLLMPRVKRGRGALPRDAFERLELAPDLAAVVRLQGDAASAWARTHGVEPAAAPLFPRRRPMRGAARSAYLEGLEWHMSSTSVSIRISRVLNGLEALPGLGDAANVFPLRLRRTMATAMSNAGCSLAEVAAALGDDGAQIALIYIEPTPRLATRIDRALGPEFLRFAARFRTVTAELPDAGSQDGGKA